MREDSTLGLFRQSVVHVEEGGGDDGEGGSVCGAGEASVLFGVALVVLDGVFVKRGEDFELLVSGAEAGGDAETGGDFLGQVTLGVVFHAAGESLGHFGEGFVVECCEGGQWGVGDEAA